MTLREALEEYRTSFDGLIEEAKVSPEEARFFRRHDLCHVVFGLDTSLRQEAMADTVTVFGVDVGFREYVANLKLDATKDVFRGLSKVTLFVETLRAIPSLFRCYWMAPRMKKKFPWDAQEPLLDRPLDEVRQEFGIRALEDPAANT